MSQKKHRIIGLTLGVALTVSGAVTTFAFFNNDTPNQSSPIQGKAKNVIVFVGDGMGAAHRDAIRLAAKGLNGKLEMDDMPYAGIVHTNSADPKSFVTDSAAAATAIATGVKSYNGAIGVDLNGKPVKTVLEQAKEAGKATGIVTTSQVTDATPAAFASHVANRSSQSDIAKQYLENSKVDVILGGGEDYWYPTENPGKYPDYPAEDPTEASKGTNGNLVDKAKQLGYTYVSNADELKRAKSNKLLGLFANEEMFQQRPEGEGDIYDPVVSLPDMTKKAIDILSKNKKGFFLLVEEEAIDEMSHENNAALTIKAGQQFDQAVAVGKAYAKQHPDTLVIVLADHDCGGLTVETVNDSDESGDGKTTSSEDGPFPIAHSDQNFVLDWTTSGHTGTDVPLTAMGPGAEKLTGIYENTHIHDVILRAMRIK
ncbi:alkaline phosphatase [Thermaerobacillus caldiproteolyticus]|uniref:alkaline phosphatase n=1 Tax=Thermaerobacillus caldiproteolyticus TaxID=247480 RepID=UPI00188B3B41|nr:alkaline phosphatase [Anoxybacillus caldiproteolyticus]QPA30921.1 alkaline phosphatase [Anoxybacillus caldiproteolyticus]